MSCNTPSKRYRKRTPVSSGSMWMSEARKASAPAKISSRVAEIRLVLLVDWIDVRRAGISSFTLISFFIRTMSSGLISSTPRFSTVVFTTSLYLFQACSRLEVEHICICTGCFFMIISRAARVSGSDGFLTAT